MAQQYESAMATQRLRSLLSRTVSGKGLFVQALTYQFALPAIANTPPVVAVLDPTPQESQGDAYAVVPLGEVVASSVVASPVIVDPALVGNSALEPSLTLAANPRLETSPYAFDSIPPPPVPLPSDTLPVAFVPSAEISDTASEPYTPEPYTSASYTPESYTPASYTPESYSSDSSAPISPVSLSPAPISSVSLSTASLSPAPISPVPLSTAIESAAEVSTEAADAPVERVAAVDSPAVESAEEFSWLSFSGLTDKEIDKPQRLALLTQEPHALDAGADNIPPILIAGPQDLNPGLNTSPAPAPSQSADDLSDLSDRDLDTAPTFSPSLPSGVPAGLPPSLVPNPEPPPAEPMPVVEDFDPLPAATDLPTATPVADTEATEDIEGQQPWIKWTDLEVGIGSDFNNFGESSWSILPALSGQLANGNVIGVASGFRQFEQDDIESVSHVPLTLSWQGDVDAVELAVSAGIDFFNRLPTDTHASVTATVLLSSTANVSMSVEQGPYLVNAQTLDNQISSWQYGPDFYWQISPEVSLFSKFRLNNYSDGNWEQQSFSRLERSIGETAAVALNVTNQSFKENVENTSGYFSPSDFLIATAELSWQEQLADDLGCGLLGSIGQQRLAGEWAVAYRAQAVCTIDIAPAVQFDLGYQLNNASNDQSGLIDEPAYRSQSILGGFRVTF